MLLTRELWRVFTDLVRFSWWNGRVWLLLAIVLLAVIAAVTTSVTVLGPVVIYPLL